MSVDAIQDGPAIPWRLRSDLEIHAGASRSGSTWTIKDPLRLAYFYAQAEEMAFLERLDGVASLNVIMGRLKDLFPDQEFSVDNLRQFLSSAVNGGLLRATVPGHSQLLMDVRRRRAAQAAAGRLTSLLCYRMRGIDPTALLSILDRCLGWIFQTKFLVLAAFLCLLAATMVLTRRAQFESELPGIVSLFTATNLPVLVIAVVLVKVLHELGHGLTCRHFGGECHELGVLLVAFMPLLYCDVSDSWLQQDRRKRMLVAAAGIVTELFLASVCAILWVSSRSGHLHTFFLNVMIVSSLNTLLVNGNPLLRYDGYFVLSDWLRIPNLAAHSRAAAVSLMDRIVLGLPQQSNPHSSIAFQMGMMVFGGASILYRFFIMITLLWIVHQTLTMWHLQSLTVLLLISIVLGLMFSVGRGIRERSRAVSDSPDRRQRAMLGVGAVSIIVVALLTVPLPYSVQAPFTLTPGICTPIYALEDGYIQSHVSFGQSVEPGDMVAVQVNHDLESLMAQADGDLQRARVHAANLSSRRSVSNEASHALPAAEKAIFAREAKVNQLSRKILDLTVVSPIGGRILPPRNRPQPPVQNRDGTSWFGQPLSPLNQSVWISRQTLLCWVGDEDDFQAYCLLDEQSIELIEEGAQVILKFSSVPSESLRGRVIRRNAIPETGIDRELVLNRMVLAANPETNRPRDTLFGVTVSLEANSPVPPLPLYSTGYVQIECAPVSVIRRAWRFVCYTFTFDR